MMKIYLLSATKLLINIISETIAKVSVTNLKICITIKNKKALLEVLFANNKIVEFILSENSIYK